jgi:hypothetical protein
MATVTRIGTRSGCEAEPTRPARNDLEQKRAGEATSASAPGARYPHRGDLLAQQLYLNAARDDNYPRRHRTRQALRLWWRAATDADRHASYPVLRSAAADYGIAVADRAGTEPGHADERSQPRP